MTDEELLTQLRNTEDSFTERKTEGDHKDFLKTVVAFANSVPDDRAAIFFVGVRNDGTVAGLTNPESSQTTFTEIFSRKCYPAIEPKPEMRVLRDGEKEYLAILIRASRNRPHFGGPAWTREGHQSVIASDKVFQELIDRRTSKVHEILKWKTYQLEWRRSGKGWVRQDPWEIPNTERPMNAKYWTATLITYGFKSCPHRRMCRSPLKM